MIRTPKMRYPYPCLGMLRFNLMLLLMLMAKLPYVVLRTALLWYACRHAFAWRGVYVCADAVSVLRQAKLLFASRVSRLRQWFHYVSSVSKHQPLLGSRQVGGPVTGKRAAKQRKALEAGGAEI